MDTICAGCCRPVSCCQAAQGVVCPTSGMPRTPGMWIAQTLSCCTEETLRCEQCHGGNSAQLALLPVSQGRILPGAGLAGQAA
jgi:hypothetical protein